MKRACRAISHELLKCTPADMNEARVIAALKIISGSLAKPPSTMT